MRLRVLWTGKTKYAATQAWTEEYLKRIRGFKRFTSLEAEELNPQAAAAALVKRAAGGRLWLLDPAGKALNSEAFAQFIEHHAATFSQELVMAIGGADGFSAPVQAAAAGRLSLSSLTLSHELARVVLLEQIYRALAIIHHHPFPH